MRIGVMGSALLALCLWQIPARAEAAAALPPPHAVVRGRAAVPTQPPPGYHEERRLYYGALITGAVLTGVGALFVGWGASLRAHAEQEGEPESRDDDRANADVLTIIGLPELLVGVPLLTFGLVARRRVDVPDQAVSVTFAPLLSANRGGGMLVMSF